MNPKHEGPAIGTGVAIVIGLCLGVVTICSPGKPQDPQEPVQVDVDRIAADVTQAAGKNLTKGMIQGFREALFGAEEKEADDAE